MFYSKFVLVKKGALGRVWLAAHWDRKLSKKEIVQADVKKSVENIIHSQVPMALRMSGHLLLGVVRIYHRKVRYLLTDANDALVKIKMAYQIGETNIDLNPKAAVASYASITLPEAYGEFEITLPEITLEAPDESELLNINIARKREITLSLTEVEDTRASQEGSFNWDYTGVDHDPLLETPEEMRQREVEQEQYDIQPIEYPEEEMEMGVPPMSPAAIPDMADQQFRSPGILTPGGVLPVPPRESPEPSIHVPVEKVKGITVDKSLRLESKYIQETLKSTGPTLRQATIAPATKKDMMRKQREIRSAEEIFKEPVTEGLPTQFRDLFARNMKTKGVAELPPLGEVPEPQAYDEPYPVGLEEEEVEPVTFETEFPGDIPGGGGEEEPEVVVGEEPLGPEDDVATASWSDRTKSMHKFLHRKCFAPDVTEVKYLDLIAGKDAKVVVGTFFELLVLKSKDIIELRQDQPYDEIFITKTEKFHEVVVV